MVPTLMGRLQTRIFVTTFIGGLWTLIVSPVLPGLPGRAGLSDIYPVTFRLLLIVGLLGLGWEVVYQGLQQFRWEKDWPTMFGLLEGIPEGILGWIVASAVLDQSVPGNAFTVHFITTWIVTWGFINGPMKVLFIRWRFQGARLIDFR